MDGLAAALRSKGIEDNDGDPDPAAEFVAAQDGDGYPDWFGPGANTPPEAVREVMA